MGRASLAGVLLVAWVGTAGAGPKGNTRKVDVETDPPGAQVYLDDINDGPVCTATPCTIDAPVNTQVSVIVRKDGYAPDFQGITVPKKGKVKTVKFSLATSMGILHVDDPSFKGATIKVDDVDKGPAPAHLDIEATSHHVVITKKGQELASEFITLEVGEEFTMKPKAPAPPVVSDATPDESLTKAGGDGDGSGSGSGDVHTATPGPERPPFIIASVVGNVGFRQQSYDAPQNGLASQENEPGVFMLGPALEFWPANVVSSTHLTGLSLYGKVELPIVNLNVLDDMNMPVGARTYWLNIEADLRQRWRVGEGGGLEVSAGFVQDQMSYKSDELTAGAIINRLPDVDYKSIRIGARIGTGVGATGELYAGGEVRLVLDGGPLQKRFNDAAITASAEGFGARIGASARFGPVTARFEGTAVRYSWSLDDTMPMPTKMTATGATDMIETLSLFLGFTH